ncbi:hypothetical protein FB382_003255 [Nocardioides ginsengisegetis]|uniref:Uncharacterized protein n=1 Tax=Nocardioides ginsengisegetis TaxID=661491 RepID=A0A7W3J2E5_9ACTN|nr:hypothetical protein [Nocardioides ginsengisegetis]MBA8804964.1 hypothetical protein [Nocardioides ginsengisegetis]
MTSRQVLQPCRKVEEIVECTAMTVPGLAAPKISPITSITWSSVRTMMQMTEHSAASSATD